MLAAKNSRKRMPARSPDAAMSAGKRANLSRLARSCGSHPPRDFNFRKLLRAKTLRRHHRTGIFEFGRQLLQSLMPNMRIEVAVRVGGECLVGSFHMGAL